MSELINREHILIREQNMRGTWQHEVQHERSAVDPSTGIRQPGRRLSESLLMCGELV